MKDVGARILCREPKENHQERLRFGKDRSAQDAEPSGERLKPRIPLQRVENRIDIDEPDPAFAIPDGALKPEQGEIPVAQQRVACGHLIAAPFSAGVAFKVLNS